MGGDPVQKRASLVAALALVTDRGPALHTYELVRIAQANSESSSLWILLSMEAWCCGSPAATSFTCRYVAFSDVGPLSPQPF